MPAQIIDGLALSRQIRAEVAERAAALAARGVPPDPSREQPALAASVADALPALKAAGKQLGATINDVVLWLCATALRDYLGAHGGLPKKSLVAAMPFSLGQGKGSANDVSMSAVSLGTHLADPAKRLEHSSAATAAMKATSSPVSDATR